MGGPTTSRTARGSRARRALAAAAAAGAMLLSGCSSDGYTVTMGGPDGFTVSRGYPRTATPQLGHDSRADERAAKARAQRQLRRIAASANRRFTELSPGVKKIYRSIHVTPDYPGGLEVAFTFRRPVPSPTPLDERRFGHIFDRIYRAFLEPELREVGLDRPAVTWRWFNPDGSPLFVHFSQSPAKVTRRA